VCVLWVVSLLCCSLVFVCVFYVPCVSRDLCSQSSQSTFCLCIMVSTFSSHRFYCFSINQVKNDSIKLFIQRLRNGFCVLGEGVRGVSYSLDICNAGWLRLVEAVVVSHRLEAGLSSNLSI
jgi:hypothetical protein